MLMQAGEKQVLQVLPWDGACVYLCTFVSASGCVTAASRRPEGCVGLGISLRVQPQSCRECLCPKDHFHQETVSLELH